MSDESRDIEIKVKGKNETKGLFAEVREELEKIKKVAGGRGTIKEIAETLGGAGAIAGVVEVAEKLGEGFKAASGAIRSINNELATADQRSLAWDQTLEKIPLIGTGARLGEGIVDLVGAIGQATGASEEFVDRWTTAGTKIAEAKAALDALANTKAFFSDGGKTAELAARSNAAGESGLELAHRQQEQRHQQDLAKARELRQRADNDFEMAPDKRQALREQADRLEQFANQVNAKELRKIDADNADAYVKVQLDAQDKIDAAHAAARQADLKLNGAVLKAELEQIDSETQTTLSQLERSLADNQKRLPEHAKELEAKFIDERDAINDAARKRKFTAEIDNENRIANQKADIESITRKTKLDGLKLEASIGNTAKKIQAEQAQIADEYAGKREAINQKLREDHTLGVEQRKQLEQSLVLLDQQEEKAKRIAAVKEFEIGLAKTQGEGITGVASISRTASRDSKIRSSTPRRARRPWPRGRPRPSSVPARPAATRAA
jgi:hypothetical protein